MGQLMCISGFTEILRASLADTPIRGADDFHDQGVPVLNNLHRVPGAKAHGLEARHFVVIPVHLGYDRELTPRQLVEKAVGWLLGFH